VDDTLVQATVFDPTAPDNAQTPIGDVANQLRRIRDQGFEVVLFTSRSQATEFQTRLQLRDAGIEFDSIIFNKPQFDLFVDNKNLKFLGTWDHDVADAYMDEAVANRAIDEHRYPTFMH
jgi:hypothetical protein